MSPKLRLVPLVLALGLLATMIPGASARITSGSSATSSAVETTTVKSTVNAQYKARKADFVGSVDFVPADLSPDEGGCVADRTVKLFKVFRRGSEKLGSTDTDDLGTFTFNFRKAQTGNFEVKVAPTSFADRYGDLIDCSGARDTLKI